MVKNYGSLANFLTEAKVKAEPKARGGSWDLNVSGKEAIKRATIGDLNLAAQAEEIVREIQTTIATQIEMVSAPSQIGRRPHVPSYIAGHPMSMRRPRAQESEGKTVKVYVNLGSACNIEACKLLNRGCAILALVEGLQRSQVRVELALVHGMAPKHCGQEDCWTIIPLDSTPLDLSVVGFALAHPAFARNVSLPEIERYSAESMPSELNHGPVEAIYSRLDLSPDDVYIPRSNWDMTDFDNPTVWVQKYLAQIIET